MDLFEIVLQGAIPPRGHWEAGIDYGDFVAQFSELFQRNSLQNQDYILNV